MRLPELDSTSTGPDSSTADRTTTVDRLIMVGHDQLGINHYQGWSLPVVIRHWSLSIHHSFFEWVCVDFVHFLWTLFIRSKPFLTDHQSLTLMELVSSDEEWFVDIGDHHQGMMRWIRHELMVYTDDDDWSWVIAINCGQLYIHVQKGMHIAQCIRI